MEMFPGVRRLFLLVLVLAVFVSSRLSAQEAKSLPSERPATFVPVTDSFNYSKRDVMIPMRDGVKLHTVIVVPRGAKNAPMLLTRTPYNANAQTSHAASSHLASILYGYDNPLDV
ncbi:MAG TPA: CocE/NonD family hydrolase, partial [Dongiaceae bacterium]|nr:CocE/NonD family hydrolase [Dongiaceae bacterium]